jgi:hypothetical protein
MTKEKIKEVLCAGYLVIADHPPPSHWRPANYLPNHSWVHHWYDTSTNLWWYCAFPLNWEVDNSPEHNRWHSVRIYGNYVREIMGYD